MKNHVSSIIYLILFFVADMFLLNHFTVFGYSPFYSMSARIFLFILVLILFLILKFDMSNIFNNMAFNWLRLVIFKLKSIYTFQYVISFCKKIDKNVRAYFGQIVLFVFMDNSNEYDFINNRNNNFIFFSSDSLASKLSSLNNEFKSRKRIRKLSAILIVVNQSELCDYHEKMIALANDIQSYLKSNRYKIEIGLVYKNDIISDHYNKVKNNLFAIHAELIDRLKMNLNQLAENSLYQQFDLVVNSNNMDQNKSRILAAIQFRKSLKAIGEFFTVACDVGESFKYIGSFGVYFISRFSTSSLPTIFRPYLKSIKYYGYHRLFIYLRKAMLCLFWALIIFIVISISNKLLQSKALLVKNDRYWQSEIQFIHGQSNQHYFFSSLSRLDNEINQFIMDHHLTVFNLSLLSTALERIDQYRINNYVAPVFTDHLFKNAVNDQLSYASVYRYIAAMVMLTQHDNNVLNSFSPIALLLADEEPFQLILGRQASMTLKNIFQFQHHFILNQEKRVVLHYLLDDLFAAPSDQLVLAYIENEFKINHHLAFYFTDTNYQSITETSVVSAYHKMLALNSLLSETYHLQKLYLPLPSSDQVKIDFLNLAEIWWKNYFEKPASFHQIIANANFICANFKLPRHNQEIIFQSINEFCHKNITSFISLIEKLQPLLNQFQDELVIKKTNINYLHGIILSMQQNQFQVFNQLDSLSVSAIDPIKVAIINYKNALLKKVINLYLTALTYPISVKEFQQCLADIDLNMLLKLSPSNAKTIHHLQYLKAYYQFLYSEGSTSTHFQLTSQSLDSRLIEIKMISPDFHYNYAHGPSIATLINTNPMQPDYEIKVMLISRTGKQLVQSFFGQNALFDFLSHTYRHHCINDHCDLIFHDHFYYWNFSLDFDHVDDPDALFSIDNRRLK